MGAGYIFSQNSEYADAKKKKRRNNIRNGIRFTPHALILADDEGFNIEKSYKVICAVKSYLF